MRCGSDRLAAIQVCRSNAFPGRTWSPRLISNLHSFDLRRHSRTMDLDDAAFSLSSPHDTQPFSDDEKTLRGPPLSQDVAAKAKPGVSITTFEVSHSASDSGRGRGHDPWYAQYLQHPHTAGANEKVQTYNDCSRSWRPSIFRLGPPSGMLGEWLDPSRRDPAE